MHIKSCGKRSGIKTGSFKPRSPESAKINFRNLILATYKFSNKIFIIFFTVTKY